MNGQYLDREFIDRRINLIFGLTIAVFLIFFSGFWYLQVIRGSYYEALATENIFKDYRLRASRGLILDRNNAILAENWLSHNLFLTPGQSKNLRNTMQFLADVLAMTPQDLVRIIQKEGTLKSLRPVLIYQDLSLPQLAYISARKIEYPELDIHHEQKRSYKYDSLFAHVIGYMGEVTEDQQRKKEFPGTVSRDIVGQAGLERYYNHYLMGTHGYERKVVNSFGAELKEFELLPPKKPVPGKVLRLGLDFNMQKAVDAAFAESNQYGAAAAINVKSGEIMLLYSKPHYNPNDFIPKIAPARWKELLSDPQHPLQNRAIQNKFSPGSTFKVVMALAALQEKKISPRTMFSCGGAQFIYNRVFRCWKPGGHGAVDLHKGIMQSCDVYFYNVGMRLDIDVIAAYARKLGFGAPTGVDLPNEARGLVPDRAWKRKTTGDKWYPGETISVAIGQGPILVTALQQASLMATVASDGKFLQPHVLSALLESKGKVVDVARYRTQQVSGIDQENYEIVKRNLWAVVNEAGTGGRARIEGYDICGKTGTVQVVGYDRGGDLDQKQKDRFGAHAWFIAFAPLADPQVALAVFVEHGGHGSEAAAPVAKKIFETYFKDRNIPPYPRPDFLKGSKAIRAKLRQDAQVEESPQ